jgi:hypothetical protein
VRQNMLRQIGVERIVGAQMSRILTWHPSSSSKLPAARAARPLIHLPGRSVSNFCTPVQLLHPAAEGIPGAQLCRCWKSVAARLWNRSCQAATSVGPETADGEFVVFDYRTPGTVALAHQNGVLQC